MRRRFRRGADRLGQRVSLLGCGVEPRGHGLASIEVGQQQVSSLAGERDFPGHRRTMSSSASFTYPNYHIT
jgi:hypothetical protein